VGQGSPDAPTLNDDDEVVYGLEPLLSEVLYE